MSGESRSTRSSSTSKNTKKNADNNCGKCQNPVTATGINAVKCGICHTWFHYPCVGIKEEESSLLGNQQIYWFCTDCNPTASTIIEEINQVKITQASLRSALESTKSDILNSVKTYVDYQLNSLKTTLEAKISNDISKAKTESSSEVDVKINAEVTKVKATSSAEIDAKLASETSKINESRSADIDTKITTSLERKVETIKGEVSKSYATAAASNLQLDENVRKIITEEVSTHANQFKSHVESYKKDVIEKEFPTLINKGVWEEATEREKIKRRECNLIVHNLVETQEEGSDFTNMVSIFKDVLFLNDINISDLTRLGEKQQGRDRLLRITVQDVSTKKRILSRATELRLLPKEDAYFKIYLRPDLTPKQQQASKNLYASLLEAREQNPNYSYKISKGKVVNLGLKEDY